MEYNAPYGSADPNAGFIDRNTPGAVSGSRVPAAAIEMPQREIVTVIKNVGLTPTNDDPTQLDQAIDKKIEAATGSGGDANYVLMTQARVRLPIYPEVLTADGKLPVISPSAGIVRVPAGYEFLHRGIFLVTTTQVDLPTAPNKTYHLRWTPSAGFELKDWADAGYNGGALAEADTAFDTSYDNMLSTRIMTNASNVATITNLINKASLMSAIEMTAGPLVNANLNLSYQSQTADYNWARAPRHKGFTRVSLNINEVAGTDRDENMYSTYPTIITTIPATRYQSTFFYGVDFMATPGAKLLLSIAA